MARAILISTTNYLLVRTEDGQFWNVHSGSGIYFGSAKRNGLIYVGCHHQPERSYYETLAVVQTGSILIFDERSMKLIGEIKPEFRMRDIHGIACIRDKLWVTCTFDNLIAIYDFGSGEWSKWYPATSIEDRDRDVNHFNGIYEIEGKLCIVAHRPAPSSFLFYDYQTLELCSMVRMGVRAHDVFWMDGSLATCSSDDRNLINTAGLQLRVGGFPRGVGVTEHSIWVGISVRAFRPNRAKCSSVLREYDLGWRHATDYLLKDVGMTLAMLPVDYQGGEDGGIKLWTDWERTAGYHESLRAENQYSLCTENMPWLHALEWHNPEAAFRWTASRRAGIDIVLNPGECDITIALGSLFPGPYRVEIELAGAPLGSIEFAQPGTVRRTFHPPEQVRGLQPLYFQVLHLWRPSECFPDSSDQRLLGIRVELVEIS